MSKIKYRSQLYEQTPTSIYMKYELSQTFGLHDIAHTYTQAETDRHKKTHDTL